MSHRRLLVVILAACALPVLTSCSTEPGTFAGAWADCYQDSKDVFGKSFFNYNPDDPYARRNGWTAQAGSGETQASRLLFNSGVDNGTRVPRGGEGRNESSIGSFWDWMIDND